MLQHTALPPPPAPSDDWALFLDVDGCLLDFALRPDAVEVPSSLLGALTGWHQRLGGALALVSGRTLVQLDQLFWPLKLPAAGLHGLELRDLEGTMRAPFPDPGLAAVRRNAQRLAADFQGSMVEDKSAGLALHWRGAPSAAGAMQDFAQDALRQLPGYRLQPGDHVLELRPEGPDKGSAIARLLEQPPFQGRTPVFAGDDLTDEHGFDVVNERGGISVLVGNRLGTHARHGLPTPTAVREWLGAADPVHAAVASA